MEPAMMDTPKQGGGKTQKSLPIDLLMTKPPLKMAKSIRRAKRDAKRTG